MIIYLSGSTLTLFSQHLSCFRRRGVPPLTLFKPHMLLIPSHPAASGISYPLTLKPVRIPHPRVHHHNHAISFSFCLPVSCFSSSYFLNEFSIFSRPTPSPAAYYFALSSVVPDFLQSLPCREPSVTFLTSLRLTFSCLSLITFVITRYAWYFPDFYTLPSLSLHSSEIFIYFSCLNHHLLLIYVIMYY